MFCFLFCFFHLPTREHRGVVPEYSLRLSLPEQLAEQEGGAAEKVGRRIDRTHHRAVLPHRRERRLLRAVNLPERLPECLLDLLVDVRRPKQKASLEKKKKKVIMGGAKSSGSDAGRACESCV